MAQRKLTDVKKVISPPLLKCSLVNCRSVKKKESPSSILNLIIEEQLDCLALTETWLSTEDDINRPFLSRLVPDNWAILHAPRKSRGGGVGFMYNLKFSAKLDTSPSFSSFECQTVLLTAASVTFRFIVIYRVPPTKKNKILKSSFIDELGDLLESTSTLSGKLVLLGDFNVHLDKSSEPEAIQLRSLLDSFGMEQHVAGPTHICGHTLDLVISRTTDNLVQSCEVGSFVSDHNAINIALKSGRSHPIKKQITFRKFKAIVTDNFITDIKQSCQVLLNISNLLLK